MHAVVLVVRDIAFVVSVAAVAASFALVFVDIPDDLRQMIRETRKGRYGLRRSTRTWRLIFNRTPGEDEVERHWQVRASRNFRLWLWCVGVMFGAALVSVALTKLASKV